MIVRFNKSALAKATQEPGSAIGVEGDPSCVPGRNKISEVEKIVGDAKRKVQDEGVPGVGVSGSNSGKGHDPKMPEAASGMTGEMESVVEEEPGLVEADANEPKSKLPESGAK